MLCAGPRRPTAPLHPCNGESPDSARGAPFRPSVFPTNFPVFDLARSGSTNTFAM